MYCTDCSTANTVDSKYCKECGAKINDGYRTMMLSVTDLPAGISEETTDALTRLLDMAFWHNEAGNVAAAITASEAALALNPNSTTAHSLLGTLYEKQRDDARAIEHFEAVLALNPDSAADRTKLEQLRRGVHVKAVAPPLAHQWVPPALRTVAPRLQKVWTARADRPVSAASMTASVQRQPLVAAGVATAVILIGGLLVVRPWAHADAPAPARILVASAPPAVSLGQSAFAAPPPSTLPAPVIMRPPVSPMTSARPVAAPVTLADPYAGGPASRVASAAPNYALPPVPARSPKRKAETLPRLSLAALPPIGSASNGSQGLAPAPVTIPAGLLPAPTATVAAAPVPQHTVVVSGLGGGMPPQGAGLSVPSSHIRISVRSAPDTVSAPAVSEASANIGGGGGERASSYQQRALSLQQSADYKGARQAYGRAIRAYQAQIAAGQDVEAAQRGLTACQTGLEICQQSQ